MAGRIASMNSDDSYDDRMSVDSGYGDRKYFDGGSQKMAEATKQMEGLSLSDSKKVSQNVIDSCQQGNFYG